MPRRPWINQLRVVRNESKNGKNLQFSTVSFLFFCFVFFFIFQIKTWLCSASSVRECLLAWDGICHAFMVEYNNRAKRTRQNDEKENYFIDHYYFWLCARNDFAFREQFSLAWKMEQKMSEPHNGAIIFVCLVRVELGSDFSIPPNEALRRTHKNSRPPEYRKSESLLKHAQNLLFHRNPKFESQTMRSLHLHPNEKNYFDVFYSALTKLCSLCVFPSHCLSSLCVCIS